jgi:hypothetical protein
MLKQFRYPTNRQALMMAITSGIVLITMAISWLVVSTDTALLNRKLHLYDDRQEQILQETKDLWRQIGVATSSQEMERRMREAGFTQPQNTEFMVPQVVTTVISSTVPAEGGIR